MRSRFFKFEEATKKLFPGSAPFSSNLKTISILSWQIASWIGVQPRASGTLTSHPCVSRQSTTWRYPDLLASWTGVRWVDFPTPESEHKSGLAPFWSKAFTMDTRPSFELRVSGVFHSPRPCTRDLEKALQLKSILSSSKASTAMVKPSELSSDIDWSNIVLTTLISSSVLTSSLEYFPSVESIMQTYSSKVIFLKRKSSHQTMQSKMKSNINISRQFSYKFCWLF